MPVTCHHQPVIADNDRVPMTFTEAAGQVLREAGEPLDAEELTARARASELIETKGKTPEATMEARLAVDIRDRGAHSTFQRTAPGMFALREWGLAEHVVDRLTPTADSPPTLSAVPALEPVEWVFQVNPERFDLQKAIASSNDGTWSTPRYRDLIAVGQRVWMATVGKVDPGLAYVASITTPVYEQPDDEFGNWKADIRFEYAITPVLSRAEIQGDPLLAGVHALRGFQGTNAPLPREVSERLWERVQGRLVPLGSGATAPAASIVDVDRALERHNLDVRRKLKEAISALSAEEFELFVVRVLGSMGFDVEHTGKTNDGGVDALAVLSLRDVTSVVTKVQAKRWAHTVGGRTVRELRGALRVDERGLIITTAEFSQEAHKEAAADGKAKIGLLGGEDLARRCAEMGIGVVIRQVPLLKLDASRLVDGDH